MNEIMVNKESEVLAGEFAKQAAFAFSPGISDMFDVAIMVGLIGPFDGGWKKRILSLLIILVGFFIPEREILLSKTIIV